MNEPCGGAPKLSRQVLVIEDTGSVAELMREMLGAMGYHVDICPNVEAGLAKFAPCKYDLVITDYTMPGVNGIELSHILRRQAPEQTILLVTGSTFRMGDDISIKSPVNAILQKPFAIAEFQSVVTKLLNNVKPAVPLPSKPDAARDARK